MDEDVSHFDGEITLTKCPACLSSNIREYIKSRDYHYNIVGLFQTAICEDCKTVFVNPMPSAEDLSKLYPDDYYSYQSPRLESRTRRLIRKILRYPRVYTVPSFARPGVMIDIGCGAGHYLLEMKRQGWEVHGVELSKGAARAGREAGLDIRDGELREAGFPDRMFDFVRSNHSFEHIPDPDPTLREMHRILRDDGKMFLGIPNYDGLWARIFKQFWWNFGLPVHTFNYSIKGITALLERNGFQVDRIVHNSDYTGLVGSAQIKRNAARGKLSSDGGLMRNRVLRLPAHYLTKLVDIFQQGDCIEIIASKKNA